MSRGKRSGVLLTLALGCVSCGGGGGGGGGGSGEDGTDPGGTAPEAVRAWGTSQDASGESGPYNGALKLATDGSGRSAAVWSSDKYPAYKVFAGLAQPGSSLSGVRLDTSTGLNNDFASGPAVALSDGGFGVFAWTQGSVRDLWIQGVILGPMSQDWSSRRNVTNTLAHTGSTNFYNPRIHVDLEGIALIAWHEYHDLSQYILWAIRYDVKKSELVDSTPVRLAAVSTPIVALEMGATSNRRFVLVWDERDGVTKTSTVKALAFDASLAGPISFGSPMKLRSGPEFARPKIAFDSTGKGQVTVLEAPSAGAGALYGLPIALEGTSDLKVGNPQALSHSVLTYSDPRLLVNSKGDGVAVWVESGATMASHLQANSTWSSKTAIATGGVFDATMRDSGEVMVIWHDVASTRRLLARRYDPAKGWESGTATLEESNTGVADPKIAMNAQGDAVAIWGQGSTLRTNRFE